MLAVGHELRLSSLWGKMKELIDAGAIGDPLYVLIELWRRPYRLGSDGWRYDIRRVGNWVLEEPIHFFDLARWYFSAAGDPVSVYAAASGRQPGHPELHDNFSAVLKFARGRYAVISQTLAAWEHHQTVKLTGTKSAMWARWSGAIDRTFQPTFSLQVQEGERVVDIPITKLTGEVYELVDQIEMVRRRSRRRATSLPGRRWTMVGRHVPRRSALDRAKRPGLTRTRCLVKLDNPPASSQAPNLRWYHGISRYQWLVLAIASAGWVFDIYEGQIFNTTRGDLLGEMIVADSPAEHEAAVKSVGDAFLGIFLAGGMVGGILFGALGDRWGRKPAMIWTILMYSVFSGVTYFATSLWQVGALRFLVAMGVGGEWAIGAALVADVFPGRARAQAASVFQASSTLGTWTASVVAIAIGSQWRYGYLVGVLPALLILFIRSRIEEPSGLEAAGSCTDQRREA